LPVAIAMYHGLVDKIRLKAIDWAKAVHESLVESLNKFTLTTTEIAGCSFQILVSICQLSLKLLLLR